MDLSLGDPPRNPLFNSTSPVMNQDKLFQFEFTKLDTPFIVISFCFTCFSSTALFRFGFSSVKQFLICRPKKSSAGDCPVTVCGVLRFRIRKFASRYSRARVLAFLSSTCLVKATLCRVVRWYAGELDPILPHEFGELLSCKLRSITAPPITAQT